MHIKENKQTRMKGSVPQKMPKIGQHTYIREWGLVHNKERAKKCVQDVHNQNQESNMATLRAK